MKHQNLLKPCRVILLLGFVILNVLQGFGQATTVTYTGMTSVICPALPVATIAPAVSGLAFSQMSRGTGVNCATASTGISGSTFNVTQAVSFSGNKYYTFSITSDASTQFTLSQVKIFSQSSTAGITGEVQYSIGAGAKTTLGTFTTTTTSTAYTFTPGSPISVPVSSVLNIWVYGYGAAATGTTLRVNNNTSVDVATLPTKFVVSAPTPASPNQNSNFSLTVQSTDAGGTARNVTLPTNFTLTTATGTGTVGGIFTGTIAAGTSSITLNAVTYNVAESGVSVVATRTAGDVLSTGTSPTFTVQSVATPSILLTGSLTPFSTTVGTPSAVQSYTVSGSALGVTDIVITPPNADFEIRTGVNVFSSSAINLTPTGGTVSTTTIDVRYNPAIAGASSGNITHVSTTASQNQAVTGSSIELSPSLQSSISFGTVTSSSAVLNFSGGDGTSRIVVMCLGAAITYVPSDGFGPTGVNSNFPSAASQGALNRIVYAGSANTVTVTGLLPSTSYHVAVYEYKGNFATTNYLQASPGINNTTTPVHVAIPVPMLTQGGLTYTENFADIANWGENFNGGIGAQYWDGVAINATGTIPNGIKTTASTATFSTFGTGGVQKGGSSSNPVGTIVQLSTGTSDNTTSNAIDFLLDFTGTIAGTLSFDWATVFNSTGDRSASLRVYASTNNITFTEITGAAVLDKANNVAASGFVTAIALPASFNNSSSARLRFYEYNGTGGTTGSRAKIAIDNVVVTASIPAPPDHLAISSVTPAGPYVNGTFSVTVQAQSPSNVASNVLANTDVTLQYSGGTGTLSGTLSGTISAGSSSITFTGLTYDVAETFTATAHRTLGDVLTDGSASITIQAPVITLTGTVTTFITGVGTPSSSQQYTVAGSSLASNIVITPPAPFEISNDNGFSWVVNPNTITLTPTLGVVPTTTLYVRYNPAVAGPHSGNITHTSGTASQNQAISGTTTIPEPTTPSTVSFGCTTGSTMIINFTGGNGSNRIVVLKAGAISYVPADGSAASGVNADFILAANQGSGDRIVYDGSGSTVTVSNLTPGTAYSIAVYEYNGIGATANYLNATPGTGTTSTTGGLSYSTAGSSYTQNFNNLRNSGTVATTGFGTGPFFVSECPVGPNNLSGWQYGRTGGTFSDVKFTVDNGSSTSGSVYSYGSTNATERALGSLSTTSTINNFGLVLINNTADVLTSVTISFTGEQWRNGGGTGVPNSLVFSYSLNGTGILSGTYTPFPALDFTSPTVSTTAAALDGNLPANQVALSATFTLSSNWNPGQALVLRWDDANDPSNDHGLAIDNFSFSAIQASVPTTQDHDISFPTVATNSMTINWINGDAQNHLVVMNTTNSFTSPATGTTYLANTSYTGTGYGSPGEQVIYSGAGNSVSVTNLIPNTEYFFRVYGYNASGPQSTYLTSTATLNPNSQFTAQVLLPTHLAITSVNGGIGVDVVKNQTFSVVVQAQDALNVPQAVTTSTGVSLSVAIGSGTLVLGNIVGTITAGQNSTTITGVIYDLADLGVSLQADQTSGTPVLTNGTSAAFNVVEGASALKFDTLPPYGVVNTAVGQIRVSAIRPDLSVDQYFTGPITISVTTGAGTITGNTVNAVAGIATFNSAIFNATGPYTLTATSGILTSPVSNTIYITNPPVLNEFVVPQYIAAKTTFVASPGTSTNFDRTPIAVCLQFDNLAPNTSFDVRIGVDSTTGPSTSFGGSNIWTGASFTGNIITNAFTTNANGSSPAKWIYIQPATSRFEPGMLHNLRIAYVKTGLVMPTAPILTGVKTITSLDVQNTARTASTTDDGAFLKGSSPSCVGGKYILFFDNTAGSGEPLYSYQARQMDATNTQQSGLPTSIDDVFRQSGTSVAGDYAGVIPSNNPNGVQRIEVRNADNSILNYTTDADGVWGTVSTVNPVRRSVATLTSVLAPLNTVEISGITSTPAGCAGNNGTATVSASQTLNANPVGTLSYSWSPSGQIVNPATGLSPNSYTVTVTNSTGGCTATASVSVGAPSLSTVTPGGPTSFCNPGSVSLTAGSGGVSWTWYKNNVTTGDITQSITATSTGTYTVTADDGLGCSLTSAPVTVTAYSFGYNGTIYSESMGTPTGTTTLSSWAGWQNTVPVTYTSTSPSPSDVRITTGSAGYTGSSGSGNIFFTLSGVRNFIISGINTLGYSGITFTFGLRRDAGTAIADPFLVEYSDDGLTFTPMTITQPVTTASWVLITPVGSIPSTGNLRLRFSKSTSTGSFRLDDVKLTGTTTTVDVAASGPTNLCPGTSVRLTSNIPIKTPPTNIWSTSAITRSIVVNTAGTYSVTVTDVNGCVSTSANVVVNTLVVDDGNACTTDACNSTLGVVTNTPVNVDDLNGCTTDFCNSSNGTITHTAVIYDDNNACTTDACNTSNGAISNVPVSIDDFNLCTNDACNTVSGSITHDAINIDDNDPCTADACDSGNGSITHTVTCGGTTLYVKVWIEGYYGLKISALPSLVGVMDNATNGPSGFPPLGGCLFHNNLSIDPNDADYVILSAMDPVTYNLIEAQTGILKTDGSINVTFTNAVSKTLPYFIRVQHRNSIETWSANPQILGATTALAPYDFTTAANKAFASNMVDIGDVYGQPTGTVWAIFSGDISPDAGFPGAGIIGLQDGIVASDDYGLMETATYLTYLGYVQEDITGDGIVASDDYGLIETNTYYTRIVHSPVFP